MPDETLRSFIDEQRQLGTPDHGIRSALLSNGWNTTDVDAAFAHYSPEAPTEAAPAPAPKAIRAASVILGLLSLGEFAAGFGILAVIYILNATLSKNSQAVPFEFVRYLTGLPVKGISSVVSGLLYAYVALRLPHMDRKAVALTITVMIVILTIELVTGSVAMKQLQTIYQATALTGG